jgi:hypothetical protein
MSMNSQGPVRRRSIIEASVRLFHTREGAWRRGTIASVTGWFAEQEGIMAIIPNEPTPGPVPIPDLPPIDNPSPPIEEPDPDRLPDENPDPNPDENDRPPKHVHYSDGHAAK